MTNREWNSAAMEHHKPTKQPAVEKWMEDSANECAEMVAEWKVPRAIANGFYGVILRHYSTREEPVQKSQRCPCCNSYCSCPCHDSTPAPSQPVKQWRVGRKVPINVYDGDRPVCQCQTAEDARFIVAAVNAAIADEKMFKREELVDIPPETNHPQVNVDHLCKDCGQPKNNSRYHLDAPGTNWGAALHWFVPRTPVPSQPCKRCSGTGVVRPAADNCPRCDGTGIEPAPSQPVYSEEEARRRGNGMAAKDAEIAKWKQDFHALDAVLDEEHVARSCINPFDDLRNVCKALKAAERERDSLREANARLAADLDAALRPAGSGTAEQYRAALIIAAQKRLATITQCPNCNSSDRAKDVTGSHHDSSGMDIHLDRCEHPWHNVRYEDGSYEMLSMGLPNYPQFDKGWVKEMQKAAFQYELAALKAGKDGQK